MSYLSGAASDNTAKTASRAYDELSRVFPVCTFSDEFYYFPQAVPHEPSWEWDRFEPEAVEEIASRLSSFENELAGSFENTDRDERIDRELLKRFLKTLREELIEVRFFESRPTFYLTVLSVGLAQACASSDPHALGSRIAGVPAFLDTAAQNLKKPPELFRRLGLEMVPSARSYLEHLHGAGQDASAALAALERFRERLERVETRDDFRLSPELFERVVREHMDCGMSVPEAEAELDLEIREMEERLSTKARLLFSGSTWQEAVAKLPGPVLPPGGALALFQELVEGLGRHCLEAGLMSPELYQSCPVRVEPVPSYLAPIRTASAYSMTPGHPPRGGSFYVINADDPRAAITENPAESPMLAAHETWPGHHLLDMNRWRNSRPVRRPLEHPLFYEGWACFAEGLAAQTGFLDRPEDSLLLDKRRYWRAVRGKVDLGLQTGALDLEAAAELLRETGMSRERARASAPRFTLNPGYQLCYTLGLRRFSELFLKRGQENIPGFVKTVMDQGEIGFSGLAEVMKA
ncbi:MAG: DUF885 family protein [bacterium]